MTALQERPAARPDHEDLAGFGYRQELRRDLGLVRLVRGGLLVRLDPDHGLPAVRLRLRFGGPAFVWTWPVVFVGQLMVALVFAELAATYPLAGCIFQWSRRLGGRDRLVRRLVHDDRLHRQRRRDRDRPAVGAAGGVERLPARRRRLGARPRRAARPTPSCSARSDHRRDDHQRARRQADGTDQRRRRDHRDRRRRPARRPAVRPRRARPVGRDGDQRRAGQRQLPLAAAGLVADGRLRHVRLRQRRRALRGDRDPRRTAPKAILVALVTSGVGGALLLLGTLMAAPDLADPARCPPRASRRWSRRSWARRSAASCSRSWRSPSSRPASRSRTRRPASCSRWPATACCPSRAAGRGQPAHRHAGPDGHRRRASAPCWCCWSTTGRPRCSRPSPASRW